MKIEKISTNNACNGQISLVEPYSHFIHSHFFPWNVHMNLLVMPKCHLWHWGLRCDTEVSLVTLRSHLWNWNLNLTWKISLVTQQISLVTQKISLLTQKNLTCETKFSLVIIEISLVKPRTPLWHWKFYLWHWNRTCCTGSYIWYTKNSTCDAEISPMTLRHHLWHWSLTWHCDFFLFNADLQSFTEWYMSIGVTSGFVRWKSWAKEIEGKKSEFKTHIKIDAVRYFPRRQYVERRQPTRDDAHREKFVFISARDRKNNFLSLSYLLLSLPYISRIIQEGYIQNGRNFPDLFFRGRGKITGPWLSWCRSRGGRQHVDGAGRALDGNRRCWFFTQLCSSTQTNCSLHNAATTSNHTIYIYLLTNPFL